MSENRTADEVREQNIRDMGQELGVIFTIIHNEVAWLSLKWGQYRLLYATSEKRIEFLNNTAGAFFAMLQTLIFEDIVLGLTRLIDPIQTGKGKNAKTNLTLHQLPCLVSDLKLRIELARLAEAAETSCEKMIDWRNKHLAHRDLALALSMDKDLLPDISRADIEAALACFGGLLNWVSSVFQNGSMTNYRMTTPAPGDAASLITHLQFGIKAEQVKRDRLMAGKSLPEDFIQDERI
jgi:hypothetical protein